MNKKTLPAGWERALLGEVASIDADLVDPAQHPDAPHIAPNHIESWTGRLLPFTTVSADKVVSPKHRFRSGQILYSKIRPYLAKAVLADFEGLCSADMYPISTSLEAGYLHRWLLSEEFTSRVSQDQGRTVLPKVNQAALSKIEVPVPPLGEQRRIVAKLEALLARSRRAKEALDSIPDLLKKFRQSVLATAFGERDSETGNRKKIIPVSIGMPDAPPLKNWSWRPLVDLAKLESGHTPRKSVPEYWGGDVPWISLRDIRAAHGCVITTTESMPTMLGVENSSARLLPEGTVVFSRDISVGYTTIMGRSMATSQHFANWICGAELSNKFLMYALMASRDSLVRSGEGTTVSTIYMPALMRFAICVPPLAEQLRIVDWIERMLEGAEGLSDAVPSRARLEQLESALLSKAFRGELVPQDPNDEPASVLLERIRAERTASAKSDSRRPRSPRASSSGPSKPTKEQRE